MCYWNLLITYYLSLQIEEYNRLVTGIYNHHFLSLHVAVFTADILVYSARSKVCGKKVDGKEITMNFDNTPNCLVTWFPKGKTSDTTILDE
jgi:hypothetical protein